MNVDKVKLRLVNYLSNIPINIVFNNNENIYVMYIYKLTEMLRDAFLSIN
jgi:hypothetical protein